ncbi:uncharacterized protein cep164 isoform X2 [Nelusetta ayraudi]|uniref:uncharacterized protein cep164 isoform X2 n=1 Tax=Nelusetta ayraudi TaxID=303726 RepID=UPI003F700A68
MSGGALIGDQMILEELYDETYTPTEQEILEYAREIGIDPSNEPELLWLAREGIVAPLPPEWKPCQDVTSDIYYFNFSTGQSIWEHPCDEHYRNLVAQERKRALNATGGAGVKNDKEKKKKKKKIKKDKKKEPLEPLSSVLGSQMSPLGSLAPLRGLDAPGLVSPPGSAPALRRPLGSSGELEPIKTHFEGPRGSGVSRFWATKQEEKVSFNLPDFDYEDDNDDGKSTDIEPSPRGSDRLLKNIHLDLDALGGGLHYEESVASGEVLAEERTEPELQDLAHSVEHSPEPPSQQSSKDSLRGRRLSSLSRDHVSVEEAGPDSPESESEKANERGESREKDVPRDGGGGEDAPGGTEEVRSEESDGRRSGRDEGNRLEVAQTESQGVEKEERTTASGRASEGSGRSSPSQEAQLRQNQGSPGRGEDSSAKEKQDCEGSIGSVAEDSFASDHHGAGEAGAGGVESEMAEVVEEDEEEESGGGKDGEGDGETGGAEPDEGPDPPDAHGGAGDSGRGAGEACENGLGPGETPDPGGRKPSGQTKTVTSRPPPSAEGSEASKKTDDASCFREVKDTSDLSGSVGSSKKDDKDESKEEQKKEASKSKRAETARGHLQGKGRDSASSHQVDRLVLHQTSPSSSLSNVPPLEQDVGLHLKTGTPAGLQRPETSRGRQGRTCGPRLRETESPSPSRESPAEDESSRRDSQSAARSGRRREECDLEERSPSEAGEGESGEERREVLMADREVAEERERLKEAKERRLRLLREELRREEEEEERKLREEAEERLRDLRRRLLSKRNEEETRLSQESESLLRELRESAQQERERQRSKLRDESKVLLNELSDTLEAERAAERERLEAKKMQDVERLKAEFEEELHAERTRLQKEREAKLSSLKNQVKITERRPGHVSSRSEEHLEGYQQELTDILQELREDVQQDHERKLEQLRDEHRRELKSMREKYLDEETAQRDRLSSAVQEDRERLQASHAVQLEKLRLQHDTEFQKLQLMHSRKDFPCCLLQQESEMQELGDQLELRAKELKSQEAVLQAQAVELKTRGTKLLGEETELGRQSETLPRLLQERDWLKKELEGALEAQHQARALAQMAREERDAAKGDEGRLRAQRDRAMEESRRARAEKEQLESRVSLLQERCELLARRVSEAAPSSRSESKQDGKRAAEATASPPASRDSPLHVVDLDEPPPSASDSPSSIDEFKRYISSHGASIQKTKLFLERESSRLVERQAALRMAQSGSSLVADQEGAPAEDVLRSLQQEAETLMERQQTVQRGNSLLQKQEEQLQELINSVAEELGENSAFEDLPRAPGEKKVTFDVTESDLSSSVGPPVQRALAESLLHITAQLNSVLSALVSLTPRHCASPYASFPAPSAQPRSDPAAHAAAGQHPPAWSWAPHGSAAAAPLYSTPITSELRPSQELMSSRWSQMFPAAADAIPTIPTARQASSYTLYTPTRSAEADSQRLQGLIDGNKKWLEMRKKDASTPLFTRYQVPPPESGLVQLGLGDNNQIRVYHY